MHTESNQLKSIKDSTTNLIPTCSTVLYPVNVHVSEAVLWNARQTMIIILVHRACKRRIKVNIVLVESWTQTITNAFIFQPRLKFCRSDGVIDNTLQHFNNCSFTTTHNLHSSDEKSAQRRRKYCVLVVVRPSPKFSPCTDPLPGGNETAKL